MPIRKLKCYRCGANLPLRMLKPHNRGWACYQVSICRWRTVRAFERRQLTLDFGG
jgi:hypothetical protein